MLFRVLCLAALLAVVCADTPLSGFDATAFCFHCKDRRNQQDHYAFPDNCHFFVQCFYNADETTALGVVRPCAAGTFFHEEILQCMPEGAIPCQDRCRDDAVTTRGCYADPTNCVNYFVCANSASYQFCCPAGTRFEEASCGCIEDETCTDACPIVAVTPAPTPTPRPIAGGCIDSQGNTLRPVAGNPGQFQLIDADGTATTLSCAPGTAFNVTSCRCDLVVELNPPQPNDKACYLWLPFESDTADHSIFKFTTDLLGSAALDTSAGADPNGGTASLAINGGRLEIPGLKTIDLIKGDASWCLWFRCGGPGNACTQSGGILSNNADSTLTDYSIIMAAQPSNQATYRVQFTGPIAQATASAAVNNGWNQFCVVYNDPTTTLWINNVAVSTQPGSGSVKISHCPYVVGDDQFFGNFNGNVDDVLVCPFALSADQINDHFTGNFAALHQQGLF